MSKHNFLILIAVLLSLVLVPVVSADDNSIQPFVSQVEFVPETITIQPCARFAPEDVDVHWGFNPNTQTGCAENHGVYHTDNQDYIEFEGEPDCDGQRFPISRYTWHNTRFDKVDFGLEYSIKHTITGQLNGTVEVNFDMQDYLSSATTDTITLSMGIQWVELENGVLCRTELLGVITCGRDPYDLAWIDKHIHLGSDFLPTGEQCLYVELQPYIPTAVTMSASQAERPPLGSILGLVLACLATISVAVIIFKRGRND